MWIELAVTTSDEDKAKTLRAERDACYGNIYEEAPSDRRWVGDLGEYKFDEWLTTQQVPHYWARKRVRGKPDFWIRNTSADLKTVKRGVALQPTYTAQVTARHAHEDVDYFVFACLVVPQQQLYLLGACDRLFFLREAQYYGEGAQVHSAYTIRKGHEVYNIELAKLTPVESWLETLKERAARDGVPSGVVRVPPNIFPLLDRYSGWRPR